VTIEKAKTSDTGWFWLFYGDVAANDTSGLNRFLVDWLSRWWFGF